MNVKSALVFAMWSVALSAQTSYFPSTALRVQNTPDPGPNPMFRMIEQTALMPYKGRACDDASTGFEDDHGKQRGNNEFYPARLRIQHYYPDGKPIFDQIIQSNQPAAELRSQEENYRGESLNQVKRSITTTKTAEGKLMIVLDEHNDCVGSKYKSYSHIEFHSYAIVGSTLINLSGGYNNSDPSFAHKLLNEIVAKIKADGIK
jgi:hypothetical protein